MAEDDMLINFKLDQQEFRTTPTFKGGRWKDRRSARKSALYNRSKHANRDIGPGTATQVVENGSLNGNSERKREEVEHARPSKKLRPDRQGQDLNRKAGTRPQQVVSSLFTFNPSPKLVFDEQSTNEELAKPSNAPLDSNLNNFTSLGLSQPLAEHLLNKMHIKAPTAVQKSAVPQLVNNDSDAFVQAETGSGKTLAYLLPIVQRLMQLSDSMLNQSSSSGDALINRTSGLFAIILAPTRELSKQISVVLESLLRCAHWVVSGTVIGGEKKKSEKARLRKGLNILIATPGRLADHLDNTEVLDVSQVRWLVLDEGDRLMELGFEQDIQRILAKLRSRFASISTVSGLPPRRSTVLCSATMKMNVQKLGEISLKDAVHIRAQEKEHVTSNTATTRENDFSAPAQLNQSFAIVPAKLRLVSLVALLKRSFARRGSVMKTLIFISCSDSVDFHFEILSGPHVEGSSSKAEAAVDNTETNKLKDSAGRAFRTSAYAHAFASDENPVRLFKLHGSLPQAVRTSTLAAFTKCKDPAVLLCTDVASRGLDVQNVDFVIEYDPPFAKEDHLHRIGRTARAGKDGRAMIFLLPGSEEAYVEVLRKSRAQEGRDLVHHDSTELLKKGFTPPGLSGEKEWENRASDWQLNIERWTLDNPTHLEQARRAYQSHIRAYATHIAEERHIFNMTELHLGHLAKAFALRDKPGSIRVPGLRPSKDAMNKDRAERRTLAKKTTNSSKTPENQDNTNISENVVDTQAAARMMRSKMKAQLQGASEFNLG